MRWIHKVGLAAHRDGRLLVARKRGLDLFILPGGKPEGDETDLETLAREVLEELGCAVADASLRGVFTDMAAGDGSAAVVVRLYSARLVGEPSPRAEIEELAWINIRRPSVRLAPSIENGILPYLRRRKSLRAANPAGDRELLQGAFEIV